MKISQILFVMFQNLSLTFLVLKIKFHTCIQFGSQLAMAVPQILRLHIRFEISIIQSYQRNCTRKKKNSINF